MLARKTGLRRGVGLTRKKGFKNVPVRFERRGPGKKVLQWEKTRRALKVRFERAGITTCELGLPGCWHNNALSFAHSRKRRDITTQEQLEEVILCCSTVCHPAIERLPKAEMELVVLRVINSRPRKV